MSKIFYTDVDLKNNDLDGVKDLNAATATITGAVSIGGDLDVNGKEIKQVTKITSTTGHNGVIDFTEGKIKNFTVVGQTQSFENVDSITGNTTSGMTLTNVNTISPGTVDGIFLEGVKEISGGSSSSDSLDLVNVGSLTGIANAAIDVDNATFDKLTVSTEAVVGGKVKATAAGLDLNSTEITNVSNINATKVSSALIDTGTSDNGLGIKLKNLGANKTLYINYNTTTQSVEFSIGV